MWILVADAAVARIFEADSLGGEWRLLRELAHPKSRAKGAELIEDRWAGWDERGSSAKDLESVRFAREVADVLDKGVSQAHYNELVLVGAPEFLGQLRKALTSQVAKRITETLTRDYAHLKERELVERVREHLYPVS